VGPRAEYIPLSAAYLIVGYPVLLGAFRDIIRGKIFNELFLMAIASLGAMAIGEPYEAVGVMLFYSLGELLQEKAVRSSRRSIARLVDLRPEFARVLKIDPDLGSTKIELTSPEDVRIGDIVEVRPGERVPLDGTIIEGKGSLDTSSLTGESLPMEGEPGKELKAGYLSQSGLFRLRVSAPFGQSSVARILSLVEEAQERKAPTEKFITKFAAIYTPFVVIAAALLAVVPPLIIPGAIFSQWLHRALVLLVISCPCALVISIPLGYFGGIGASSRHKILVKGAGALDSLLKLDTVVFDKTGTLTEGRFELKEIAPYPGFEAGELLALAAAVERYSSHPLALAIRKAAEKEDINPGKALKSFVVDPELFNYEESRGLGVSALVEGRRVLAGSLAFLRERGIRALPGTSSDTSVYLAVDSRYAGFISAADKLKDGAPEAVAALKGLSVKKIIMLSGDREETASRIAAETGMDDYAAGLLPEDKLARVEAMKASMPVDSTLAFVGDGMNDAPVLARADLGIAMGGLGSDAALEASDIVIMDDKLSRLPDAIRIAAFTRKVVIQNIVFTLGIKLGFLALGAFGLASMWEAVIADVGVALLAVLNATRVSKAKYAEDSKA
jgi:Cd2+/Zn2+-exporting ATPase